MEDRRDQTIGNASVDAVSLDAVEFQGKAGKSRLVPRLLAAAAIAPLLLTGMARSGRADEVDMAKIQKQLNALQAQVRALKSELRHQARENKETNVKIKAVERHQTMGPYAYGGPGVPSALPPGYTPPFWDKSFHLGPVTLTPGGFIEGAGVWRQHSEQADIASTFGPAQGGLPFPNNPLYHMQESRFSGRQTRPSLLAQAELAPGFIVSGYTEFDFLGAAQTANGIESNSYNPRIRQMYVSLDWEKPGVHVLAGAAFTLLMLNGQGLNPRSLVTAPFIDADFIPGQVWERGAQVRFWKDLGPFTAGISFENPQNYFAACPGAGGFVAGGAGAILGASGFGSLGNGTAVYCQSPGGQFMNNLNLYSFNHIPDIVTKLAWDGNLAGHKVHTELMGYYSDLYDQVAYGAVSPYGTVVSAYAGAHTVNTTGWGVGGGIVASIIPKFLDTEDQVFYGRGIGRFGTSLLPADTFNADGSISPIPEIMFLGSLTAHVTPWLDLWVGGGFEHEWADYIPGTGVGVGSPLAVNTGCLTYSTGAAPAPCTGATQTVWQATGGFWDKIYSGPAGTVRWGMQYSYTQRQLFAGVGGAPKTYDNMVLTALRWYPFEPAAAPPPVIAKY